MKSALYIHIPFCRSKCSYCDFFSVAHQGKVPDAYIDSLEQEINFRCRQYDITGFTTVYIGGGTPSLLTENQISRLCSIIRSSCTGMFTGECTIEANPADITGSFLSALMNNGINRLSVGIQSVDQQVLKTLNRRSDADCIQRCLELLKTQWIGSGRHLSLDFISGLPGLSDDAFIAGLAQGTAAGADHLSLYALTLEEGTVLYRQVEEDLVTLDEEQNDRQWELGCDYLKSHGFQQYEVSNFSKPDCHSRHNCTYWHMEPYLGIGAGGTGTIGSDRWTNSSNIHEYVKFWTSQVAGDSFGDSSVCIPQEYEFLDGKTQEEEFLMMGFRLLEGVSAEEYYKRFGKKLADRLGLLWDTWESRGKGIRYTSAEGETMYALTQEGILVLNRFLLNLL